MKVSRLLFLSILLFQKGVEIHAQLPSHLPTNGLVAWYPFNGNANDESGNGNNGQAQGAILTSDRFGDSNKAYSFNGNLDNITTSLQQTNISSYTVSAWFKTNHGGWILTGRQVDSGDHSIRMLVNIDGVTAGGYGVLYGTDGDGNTDNTTTVANYNDNQWHHAVGVWDGSNSSVVSQFQMKLYIDGTLVPQTPGTSVGNGGYGGHPNIPISGNSVCRFGISPGNYAPQSLIGQLDDIAIYNRALSAAEVTALYTATAANTGGGTTSTSTAPPGIPYQAEVRNDSGEVLANANVNVRFTLHELTANGTVSYQETHVITTNELGLFAATIGAGTATQGTFAGINWAQTTKFLEVEVDAGNGYITMGNQQLMSVPYALYAANGPAGPQGPVGPQGPAGEQGQSGINGLTSLINVSNTLPDSNCPQGGIKIETGLDYNINNILDSTEINSIQTKTICFPNETNSNLNNLIFGSRNISSNSELNNAVTIVSESGNGIWCCGPTHTVPAGKLWKIAGYSGVVSSGLLTGETWLDEGQSITFQGNSNNGGSIPYSFTAFEYTKSELDFSVVSNYGTGIWCCGPSFTVPSGKIWKVIGYSGAVNSGIMNGETWLDEGQSLTFQGNSNNGGGIPFRFIAFEYSK